MYHYSTIITRVIDGDTLECDVDLGFDIWMKKARVRIANIDCPEIRTRDLIEKEFGFLAKAFVEKLFPIGCKAVLYSERYQRDSFARIVGDFILPKADGIMLSHYLLDNYHAVHWVQGENERMDLDHLYNRKRLMESGSIPKDVMLLIEDLEKERNNEN